MNLIEKIDNILAEEKSSAEIKSVMKNLDAATTLKFSPLDKDEEKTKKAEGVISRAEHDIKTALKNATDKEKKKIVGLAKKKYGFDPKSIKYFEDIIK